MRVAVVGATGVVGETILRVLRERGHGSDAGKFASRARDDVQAANEGALAAFGAVFFAGSEDASEALAPAIVRRGGIVIDNSSTFRMRDGVPLIVPEVNAHVMRADDLLFPVANCTAIILCLALAPVRDAAGLRSAQVATYQAISGAGRVALQEFDRGEGAAVRNVVPQIGSFGEGGSTGEEAKVRDETRKILELPQLSIEITCARVPVRTAHSEAVFFETARPAGVRELSEAFERAPGVVFHRDGIVTPREVEGTDEVHVARLRACERPNHFQMWICGDQLRKGAATNAVQILELLMRRRS
ncbi:MAG: Asd/ArgC dimerization domain-containing protein [Candidatus Baltobacteraceae bacterium]